MKSFVLAPAFLALGMTAAGAAPVHVDVTGTVQSLHLAKWYGNTSIGRLVDESDAFRGFMFTAGMGYEASFVYDAEEVIGTLDYGTIIYRFFDNILQSLVIGGLQVEIAGGPDAYHSVSTRDDDWICCGPDGLFLIDSLVLNSQADDELGNHVMFAVGFNDDTATGLDSMDLPDANARMFSLPLNEVAHASFNYIFGDETFSMSLSVDSVHAHSGGASVTPVPLPSSAWLMLVGPLAFFGIRKFASR